MTHKFIIRVTYAVAVEVEENDHESAKKKLRDAYAQCGLPYKNEFDCDYEINDLEESADYMDYFLHEDGEISEVTE